MALLYCDGFDWAGLPELRYNQHTFFGEFNEGRNSPKALKPGYSKAQSHPFPEWTTTGEVVVGFAWANQTNTGFWFRLMNDYNTCVEFNWSGTTLTIKNANGSTLGTFDGYVVAWPLQWQYFEARVKVGNADGEIEVRIDEQPLVTYTGVDTQAGSGAFINGFMTGANGSNDGGHIDDLYILDTTGTHNNTFLGDCVVDTLIPNGTGDASYWTPSSGYNYAAVDDMPDDSDGTYVQASSPGARDLYSLGNLGITQGQVYGVQVCATTRKSNFGVGKMRVLARLQGEDSASGVYYIGSDYQHYLHMMDSEPGPGDWSWAISSVNSLQVGIEVEE